MDLFSLDQQVDGAEVQESCGTGCFYMEVNELDLVRELEVPELGLVPAGCSKWFLLELGMVVYIHFRVEYIPFRVE